MIDQLQRRREHIEKQLLPPISISPALSRLKRCARGIDQLGRLARLERKDEAVIAGFKIECKHRGAPGATLASISCLSVVARMIRFNRPESFA